MKKFVHGGHFEDRERVGFKEMGPWNIELTDVALQNFLFGL